MTITLILAFVCAVILGMDIQEYIDGKRTTKVVICIIIGIVLSLLLLVSLVGQASSL